MILKLHHDCKDGFKGNIIFHKSRFGRFIYYCQYCGAKISEENLKKNKRVLMK